MPGILDATTIDLPPTLTYRRREATLIPGDRPGEFHLTIRLWKGRRAGSRMEEDTYAVEEEDSVGVPGRSFLLVNLTDDSQPDAYRCVVGGRDTHCTCTAGQCRVPAGCKHRDSLAALIEECGL